MRWTDGQIMGFDLETTDADPMTCFPVSYALALWRPDTQRFSVMTSIVNPASEIAAEAVKVHGITQERAEAEGIPIFDALEFIVGKLTWAAENEIPVVIFNAAFDLTIVHNLFGIPNMPNVLDPFVLDKHIDQYRKGKRTLGALSELHQLPTMEAHDATNDAVAAVLVLLKQAQATQWLPVKKPHELHRSQINWAREQQESLSDYFVKQGKPAIPANQMGWPIRDGALTPPPVEQAG